MQSIHTLHPTRPSPPTRITHTYVSTKLRTPHHSGELNNEHQTSHLTLMSFLNLSYISIDIKKKIYVCWVCLLRYKYTDRLKNITNEVFYELRRS